MSEKMFRIEYDPEDDTWNVISGNQHFHWHPVEPEAKKMLDQFNTAADAWRARENEDLRQEIAEQKDYIEQLLKEIKLQRESSKHPF